MCLLLNRRVHCPIPFIEYELVPSSISNGRYVCLLPGKQADVEGKKHNEWNELRFIVGLSRRVRRHWARRKKKYFYKPSTKKENNFLRVAATSHIPVVVEDDDDGD